MTHYLTWATYLNDFPKGESDELRGKLRQLFNTLAWIPKPCSDRAWNYRHDDNFHMCPPKHKSTAPQVLINPAMGEAVWDHLERVTVDGEEEEEEEEEEEDVAQTVANRYVVPGLPPQDMDALARIALRREEEESSGENTD
ncbi:hypothetical protein BV22DRAFT_1051969 [Leucogyrophana mollusca]|uniref:Uncharacterized protein n=1 Tax=Leucogyrophana mollusca TaxID=85980 RepID=A0ACB8AXJ6_9AGAM|nr:hypothetical protein BV22DRAFT_1051969 [Leucogyrophana mollusca]